MYTQKEWSNWFNTPYEGGMCLKFVQDAWNTIHMFPTAEAERQAHICDGTYRQGIPELGIEVPVYFFIAGVPAGHIAIRLADGKVASSSLEGWHPKPYIHNSIQDLERFYSCAYKTVYLGWSTTLANKVIVEENIPPKPKPPKPIIKKARKNMYITGSNELKRNLLVIVDTQGLRIQTFTNQDDLKNILWGGDLTRKIHANNNDFLSHMWTYEAIRNHYKDWGNRQQFINDILNCEKGKTLYYRF